MNNFVFISDIIININFIVSIGCEPNMKLRYKINLVNGDSIFCSQKEYELLCSLLGVDINQHKRLSKEEILENYIAPLPQESKRAGKKGRKVDMFDEEDNLIKTFDSVSKAAQEIEINQMTLYSHLSKFGFHKYKNNTLKFHSEINDVIKEIEDKDKKPYEFSKRIS